MQSDQRERLLAAKLAGLVRSQSGADPVASQPGGEPESRPELKGALTVLQRGSAVFGLIERGEPGPVASAVLWARRSGCDRLRLFVDDDASTAARFASYFVNGVEPTVVMQVDGASARVAAQAPVPAPAVAPELPEELIGYLQSQQLEVVVEHGVVRGELLGLEVARLVRWPASHGGDDELHLEAGVGRFDRDAVAAVNADISPQDALARTVDMVRKYRYPGAPVHPLQLLNRERWLRATLIREPKRIGAARLAAVAMTTEADGMRDPHPAAAFGERTDGRAVLVVCSTGIDMAAVPLAADLRASLDPSADLVIAVPARDHHRATVELAGLLEGRVEVVGTEVDWG